MSVHISVDASVQHISAFHHGFSSRCIPSAGGTGIGNAKLHKGNLRNIPIKVVVGEVKLQGAANVLGRFSSLKDLKSDPKHMPHPVRYTIVNNSTQILFFHFKIHKLNCLYEILLAVLIQNLL